MPVSANGDGGGAARGQPLQWFQFSLGSLFRIPAAVVGIGGIAAVVDQCGGNAFGLILLSGIFALLVCRLCVRDLGALERIVAVGGIGAIGGVMSQLVVRVDLCEGSPVLGILVGVLGGGVVGVFVYLAVAPKGGSASTTSLDSHRPGIA